MQRYGVFLRAVNVGGTGKLPMAELREICAQCGFADVKTYIASGNVALSTALPSSDIKRDLEDALQRFAGKPVGVFVRTHAELAAIVAQNPFATAPGNQVTAVLVHDDPHRLLEQGTKGQADEEIVAGENVIYVHYPSGMGQSKLQVIGAASGTARNMNTITKMAQLSALASH